MKRLVLASVASLALVVAGGIGYFIAQRSVPAGAQSAAPQSPDKNILYWYDPMKPEQHFDHPGLSPMGMQMVPKYASEGGAGDQNVVRVSPAEVQNLGMRTTEVNVGRLADTVHVPGTIAWDPSPGTSNSQ
jgi:Cu(I)/Ag(I) efflux system membrane fusion protein